MALNQPSSQVKTQQTLCTEVLARLTDPQNPLPTTFAGVQAEFPALSPKSQRNLLEVCQQLSEKRLLERQSAHHEYKIDIILFFLLVLMGVLAYSTEILDYFFTEN